MAWRAKRQVAAKTSRHGVPESFVLTAKQFQVCTKVTKDAKSSMALEAAPLHTQMFRIWTSSVPSGCSLTVRIIAVLSGFANVQFLWVSWLQTKWRRVGNEVVPYPCCPHTEVWSWWGHLRFEGMSGLAGVDTKGHWWNECCEIRN